MLINCDRKEEPMKKITKKLLFDLIMALLWISLMIYSLTGAYWHEVLGLVVVGLFGIHIIYNIPKIKREIPRMFQKGKRNLRLRYGIDFALMIFGLFTGISGVLISKEILTSLDATNIPLWTTLHIWSAYIALGIIAIHIGQHMDMIVAVIAKPFKQNPKFGKTAKSLWNLVIIGVVMYGFIANTNVALPSTSVAEATTDQTSTQDTVASQSESTTTAEAVPTLTEFLSGLICTACHRNCPLTAPQCGRGADQVQSAKEEYTQLYGSVEDIQINVGDTTYVSNLS
jgi:cytochrome c5